MDSPLIFLNSNLLSLKLIVGFIDDDANDLM